jgi:hypothetical protein
MPEEFAVLLEQNLDGAEDFFKTYTRKTTHTFVYDCQAKVG